MVFNNKGQAALEFLTTYGWAFLVILVMIGGLAYFKVFDFTGKLPDSCSLDGKLACGDTFVLKNSPDGTLQLQIQNNNIKKVIIKEAKLIERSIQNDGEYCTGTPSNDVEINPNSKGDVIFDLDDLDKCGISDNAGQKKTFEMIIKYTIQGSNIEMTSHGSITKVVETE